MFHQIECLSIYTFVQVHCVQMHETILSTLLSTVSQT